MITLTLSEVKEQLRDGKIECMTDLRIGYVEIRTCLTDLRFTIIVTK